MKLRIKFKKYGALRFIGHLDVMRYFQKALRQAEIDVAYTSGYSPHQVMSFASPLGVGLCSNGEYMDIRLNSLPDTGDRGEDRGESRENTKTPGPCEILIERLNAAGAPGLEAVSARFLPEDAKNAMASVAAASYTVRFREGRGPREAGRLKEELAAFLSRESICIVKETKKGVREANLRPGIYEFSWDGDAFHMLLNASSGSNIKPGQVIGALFDQMGEALQENALLITREDLYTDLGEGEGHRFLSLGEVGESMPLQEIGGGS